MECIFLFGIHADVLVLIYFNLHRGERDGNEDKDDDDDDNDDEDGDDDDDDDE